MTVTTHLGFDEATTPDAAGALPVGGAWTGFGGAFGGVLVAAAARSMDAVAATDGRTLRSIHVDLQGAVAPGVLELDPSLDRSGRTVSFASVGARQAGRERFSATGIYGDAVDATGGPGSDHAGVTLAADGRTAVGYAPRTRALRPDVPPVDACQPWVLPGSPALTTIEYRPANANLPAGDSGLADFHVWMRIIGDDAPVDQARALALLDAPAPGLYATVDQAFPIPTVEFTAHLLPAVHRTTSPWVLARMQTVVAAEGYAVDDCELWSEDGALIALGRQLRRAIVF